MAPGEESLATAGSPGFSRSRRTDRSCADATAIDGQKAVRRSFGTDCVELSFHLDTSSNVEWLCPREAAVPQIVRELLRNPPDGSWPRPTVGVYILCTL